jgi:hypothetical protein
MRSNAAAETFDQYTRRILSYTDGGDPRAIIRKTPARLARRIRGVTRRRLAVPARAGQVVGGRDPVHLSEIEMLWGYRLRAV